MILRPRTLLGLEGLLVFVAALVSYGRTGGNWLLFVLLILAPDLSMFGYLAGPRVGAGAYNFAHTYVLPAVLAGYGLWSGSQFIVGLALIWFAHIGADRVLGFGLKYPTAFKDTHLQRV
ncbi:MAG TPA: DUF4260 domain-containing protein [bacterium]|jgi:hypothetical protein|nr:DUF4260 domain-containing protein [bacterium]